MGRLARLNVIITRPSPHGEALAKKIRQEGGQAILFPTLEIENLKKGPLIREILDRINDYHYLVFTSQNAVKAAREIFSSLHTPQVIALGPSTAKLLNLYGVKVAAVPDNHFDSEHVVALPIINSVANKKILIMTGEGGRDFLQEQLQKKEAIITTLPLYRRNLPLITREQVAALTRWDNKIIVSTSCESLANLITVLRQYCYDDWLNKLPLVIISERMKKFALCQGMEAQALVLAKNATDEAILESLIKWYSYSF